jgi:hypothetical protein
MTSIIIKNAYFSLADAEAEAETEAKTVRAGTLNAEAVAMTKRACTLKANADEIIKAALSERDAAFEAMTIPISDIKLMFNNTLYKAATMRNTARQLAFEAIRLTGLATEEVNSAIRVKEHRVFVNASVMFG